MKRPAPDTGRECVVQVVRDAATQHGKTAVIMHRLPPIRKADRIVALEAGRTVDIGQHDELVARRAVCEVGGDAVWAGGGNVADLMIHGPTPTTKNSISSTVHCQQVTKIAAKNISVANSFQRLQHDFQ